MGRGDVGVWSIRKRTDESADCPPPRLIAARRVGTLPLSGNECHVPSRRGVGWGGGVFSRSDRTSVFPSIFTLMTEP